MVRRTRPIAVPNERLAFLEGLRGVLAFYVLAGHIGTLADPAFLVGARSQASPGLAPLLKALQYGHVAVAGFIVLSGYCLQLSLYASRRGTLGSIPRFYGRRALRILPAYYACLLASTWVAQNISVREGGLPFSLYLPVTDENWWAHFFLVHNFRPDWMYKINGVLWSIAIEVQLYLLFPVLVMVLAKYGRAWLLGGTALTVTAAMLWAPNAMKLYPWYALLFAGGMAAAKSAYRPNVVRGVRAWLGTAALAVGLLACGFAVALRAPLWVGDLAGGLAIAGTCFLMTVSPHNAVSRLFGSPALLGLGAFSYSLYLMHHPLLQVVYAFRPAGIERVDGMFWYLVAVTPLVLLGCWLFSQVFERPILRRTETVREQELTVWAPVELPLRPVPALIEADGPRP